MDSYTFIKIIIIYIAFILGFSIILEFICEKKNDNESIFEMESNKVIENYVDITHDRLEKILENAKQNIKQEFLKKLNTPDSNDQRAEIDLINKVNSYVKSGDRIGNYMITETQPVKSLFRYDPNDNYFYLKK